MPTACRDNPESGSADRAVDVPNGRQFTLHSKETGKTYRIFYTVPADPPDGDGYPAIYMLDGNATFLTGAETLRLQTRKPKGFAPAVFVAIGYETDQPFAVDDRYLDYTTPAPLENLPERKNGEPWPERGGADSFLEFIQNRLKPEMARRLPLDQGRETLAGHSLGGFFAAHAFLSRPDSFSTYCAGSPSVWWNASELLRHAETQAASADFRGATDGKRLLITVGADEHEDMVQGARELAEKLGALRQSGLTLDLQIFDKAEHITVLPSTISRTIVFSLSETPLEPGSK